MEEIIGRGKLIQRKANASIVSEHLVIEIKEMIESSRPLLSPGCCIYKVPDHFRKMNEEAYTPRVISMGPFHHGSEKLQTMEKYKVRYLMDFMKRAKTNLEKLLSIIKDWEETLCECYAETIEFNSDDFVKMILLDATFIIEYFLRNKFRKWTDEDRIMLKPWLTARMQLDFLLLENQLPFFIMEKLYELVSVTNTIYPPFIDVTFHYFGFFNTQNISSDSNQLQIKHFVDLLRSFYLPPLGRTLSERKLDKKVEEIYCATQLAEAGLTFRLSPSNCYLDLKYKDGVLEIPRFTLDNTTEIYARNLMALEQCHYPREAYVTDYFFLLDFLIDTGKDVGFLASKKILVNGLGDDNATFVNNLGTNVEYSSMNSEYCLLCEDLVKFYDNPRHRWKAILRRDYFSSPWRIASTTAAVILLVLTSVQTVCSIISILP
ncbi:hypothetical protein I3843_09G162400 [Carya illinoinensis]|uniref:Uncharacterized protein n=1 Tax=Carya illinoinensis TaxID=32201 RepID=A0A922E4V6_CARIL|nr:hypothetical protein I3760_09G164400 [Carya illinoinensis]KAG6696807.1 hypothetical protein I3842_09G167500 [Carya illinoinensis]KAG6696808.1 hypothetical protein I3842_09G167500 [Carya illinoinensis]KAG7964278.1 hypothetical protein I3843_09G162400 [Carya illinoinensis]